MAKGFNLRLSLPSIRICRSKRPSSLPKSPSKSPAPVLTQCNPNPNNPLLRLKVITFMSGCVRKFGDVYVNSLSNEKKDSSPALPRLCDSPVPVPVPVDNNGIPCPVNFSFSEGGGGGGGRLSSDQDRDNNEDSEGLLSSCSSFDSSTDFGYALKTIKEARVYGNKRNKRSSGKAATLMATLQENEDSQSAAKRSVNEQLMPCMVEGKVNESYAVMKKSEDPYDDFKKSMMEMIMEKKLSESKDLEDLLMCLLSLNSKDHHPVIIEAFGEVWEELFIIRL